MVGLDGDEKKFPGEISGGMRKRAGLARSLVLDPQIILCDEPDSGLDPVRTAYLSQLLIDINAQIDATILIVTHNINIARTVPDNMGMLFRKHLVMFGPREVLLTSDEPVVRQFLNGRRLGPIGMSEEKDEATMAEEQAMVDAGHHDGGVEEIEGVPPQIQATPGMPERKGVGRRQRPGARDPAHAAAGRAGGHPRRPRGHPQVLRQPVRRNDAGTATREEEAPTATIPVVAGAPDSPTGAPRMTHEHTVAEQKTTFCRICEPLCGMVATVEDGRLVSLRPDTRAPAVVGFRVPEGHRVHRGHNDPDRVTTPLRRRRHGTSSRSAGTRR